MRLTDGYVRNLLRSAQRQGWRIQTTDHHVKLVAPDGGFLVVAATASDWRAFRNVRSWLRARGVDTAPKPRVRRKRIVVAKEAVPVVERELRPVVRVRREDGLTVRTTRYR